MSWLLGVFVALSVGGVFAAAWLLSRLIPARSKSAGDATDTSFVPFIGGCDGGGFGGCDGGGGSCG